MFDFNASPIQKDFYKVLNTDFFNVLMCPLSKYRGKCGTDFNWLVSIYNIKGSYYCRVDLNIGELKEYTDKWLKTTDEVCDFVFSIVSFPKDIDVKILTIDEEYSQQDLKLIVKYWLNE